MGSSERTGGLRLCACLHPLAYHSERPLWYGADKSEMHCAFCDCTEPELGRWQGYASLDNAAAAAEWRERKLRESGRLPNGA